MAATFSNEPLPTVVEADDEDLRRAVQGALERSGHTYAELAQQARSGHFSTVRARLAWVAIGGLKPGLRRAPGRRTAKSR